MSNTVHNIILLQWLVVEGFQRCNLKLLFRQTRLSSPDSPPLQVMQFRYPLFSLKFEKINSYKKKPCFADVKQGFFLKNYW